MTNALVKKNISYITDVNGKKTAILIPFLNKKFEKLIEDIVDNFDILERENEKTRPFSEIDNEILAQHGLKNG